MRHVLPLVLWLGLVAGARAEPRIEITGDCSGAGGSVVVVKCEPGLAGGPLTRALKGPGFFSPLDGGYYNPAQNGSDNSAALIALRRAAGVDGQVVHYTGTFYPASGLYGGPKHVVWHADGPLTYPGGAPVGAVQHDLTESVIYGVTDFLARNDATPGQSPVQRIDRGFQYDGGPTNAGVNSAQQVNCNNDTATGTGAPSPKPFNDYVWCQSVVLKTYDAGPGQHVAISGTAFRDGAAAGLTNSSPIWAGLFQNQDNTGRYLGNQIGIEVDNAGNHTDRDPVSGYGRRIVIQGAIAQHAARPTQTVFVDTVAGSDTLRVVGGLPQGVAAGDSIVVGPGASSPGIVGAGSRIRSVSGATIVMDSPASQTRSRVPMAVGDPFSVDTGVLMGANDFVGTFGRPFTITAPYTKAGFDASQGTSKGGAPAFRMADTDTIALDAANARTLGHNAGGFCYTVNGACVFNLRDDGTASATRYREALFTPTSSSQACHAGQFADDTHFHYVCVGENHWRRVALSDF